MVTRKQAKKKLNDYVQAVGGYGELTKEYFDEIVNDVANELAKNYKEYNIICQWLAQ